MASQGFMRRFRAVPENVGAVRREVQAFAVEHGVADPHAVALAVSETVTNAVLHAYVDRDPGQVEVRSVREPDDGLRVVVTDDGLGMRPRPDSPGMGVGLPLAASLAERFEIEVLAPAGTKVCMWFAVA